MKLKALSTGFVAVAIGVGVAACGGSSSAGGIVTAPSGGATAPASTTAKAATTTSSSSSSTVPIPKTGALSKEPVFSVPTGAAPKKLTVRTVIAGAGTTVKSGDTVYVSYVGKLYKGGKTFDASWKDEPGETYEVSNIGSASVIAGWNEGLIGLKQGGRYELIIPPSLAYGSKEDNGIPGNSTLVFMIDIVKVTK